MNQSTTEATLSRTRGTKADLANMRRLAANTVRGLAMDAVQKANSGHPGMPMGMADAAVVLWTRFLKHNPTDPTWPDRDRFVLSAGHGSMLLYSLLHLSGYDLPIEQLRAFRQWDSRTPGHPEFGVTPGVETTSGPLGQGISNGVGMAMAERWLAERFNRPGFNLIDHHTYVIVSDGDLMEGISHEACALAAHLGLGKLIVLYDDNGISIDGPTSLAFSEDVLARFGAYGWFTQRVDGHDSDAVESAIERARKNQGKPSLIACKTHIGFGSPHRQDTAKAHGEPLGADEVRLAKEKLGLPVDRDFYVPEDAADFVRESGQSGAAVANEWQHLLSRYQTQHPDLAEQLLNIVHGELPENWDRDLPIFAPDKPMATRAASGAVLEKIVPHFPALVGGSADLTGSNNTLPKGERALSAEDFSGRYIHFGVREHGMGGILNGMALHGLRVYGGTFLIFSEYMRAPIRLAALMKLPVIYVFTHDSIGLGEDGPTHQPVEQLTSLRAIPNLAVFRPADANETVEAWRFALARRNGPTALVLTRQAVPTLDRQTLAPVRGAARGGYILRDTDNPQVILMATGSEVQLALTAQELLAKQQVRARVVSMPCWEAFDAQPGDYREAVLPSAVRARIAVEAGATLAWSRYVGLDGAVVGLDRFGESAPSQILYEKLGITAQAVVEAAHSVYTRVISQKP